ncbi:hypothetical protein BDR06DRAFT_947797 [Suillus hirtellus]|nr:hypothetical protein BDR06DRAFT_947797 [Suillus hirtellus]
MLALLYFSIELCLHLQLRPARGLGQESPQHSLDLHVCLLRPIRQDHLKPLPDSENAYSLFTLPMLHSVSFF